jgi:hypothetical protein
VFVELVGQVAVEPYWAPWAPATAEALPPGAPQAGAAAAEALPLGAPQTGAAAAEALPLDAPQVGKAE